jgi:hypothetical protein
MGQLRNILRAIAWEHDDEPPARLVARLDNAMADLALRTMTTLIVARIEQDAEEAADGLRRLRWFSAGHPPPIVISAAGDARLLAARSDPPLAVAPHIPRADHEALIGPGETLLLYTDGLVETRTDPIAARLDRLVAVLSGRAALPLDDLLNTVLLEMVGDRPDDDVALIAVRFHPEDRARPAEAGPGTPTEAAPRRG